MFGSAALYLLSQKELLEQVAGGLLTFGVVTVSVWILQKAYKGSDRIDSSVWSPRRTFKQRRNARMAYAMVNGKKHLVPKCSRPD